MILDLIGIKRTIILGILLGANVGLYVFSQVLFAPQMEKATKELSKVKRQSSRYQKDLNAIKNDFDALGGQQEIFNKLTEKKFFGDVSMPVQLEALDLISQQTGVDALVKVSAPREMKLSGMDRVDWVMVKREIVIDIKAFDDVDIYRYLDRLQKELPGYLKLKDVSIRRTADYSADMLREIIRGKFPDIVTASLNYDWYLMKATNAQGDASTQGRR
ncbi:MAG: hypothetical protein CL570_02830 [Alphaproteobacteria bacterium]|nr:hypothetical protein [Alphaproteobacteria bacterium]HCQ70643.1 hypothetical protein [Rhodospirillaceae bacterium]|tara:strand:+ start:13456 stop:14106 length:651 start_codon:yes stop_codon:yes gene_type:complete